MALVNPLLGESDVVTYAPLGDSFDPGGLPENESGFAVIVLDQVLRGLDPPNLKPLLQQCHDLLGDRGRLVLADRLVPFDSVSARSSRKMLRWLGVKYTSNDVFSMLERAGFWECLVLRKGGLAAEVVIRGDKVVQRAALDQHPTLQTNPTFKLVKK